MLSDESSSDSETGRFKGKSEKPDQQSKNSNQRDKNIRSSGGRRHGESNRESSRFQRDGGRKWDGKEFVRGQRQTYSRLSPIRRRSNDRRRSRERYRRVSREKSRTKDVRSSSRDRQHLPKSKSHKPADQKRDIKEIRRNVTVKEETTSQPIKQNTSSKFDRGSRDKQSSSPDLRGNRSEVCRPSPTEKTKKSRSPIVIEDQESDIHVPEEVRPGSYYNMLPTVVKDKPDPSSEIDSSDDEKLRAKLLNLEKELHQAKKRKHKKKHRRKDKTLKETKFSETATSVEVSSTTDIQEKVNVDASGLQVESAEVTSTQKNSQVESNEEGEIVSDEDTQNCSNIDPADLRHKIKRSVRPADTESKGQRANSRVDVCGPVLPPHLENHSRMSYNNMEGPALPPHLCKTKRTIGPSITDEVRKELAQIECEVIKCESSDDDGIGPVPAGTEAKWSEAHRELEERALGMKIRALDGHSVHSSKIKSREEWMLELPEGKAKYLGVEARTFRAKEGPDMSNRSSWTDTPEQKAKKKAGLDTEDPDVVLQREARARQLANRDEDQEKAIRKHKKKHKRDESLLELHEKKMKKKKKKLDKDEEKERRPFSRDVDLQVNRFDEAQKRSVIKKAQELDTRFSRGEAKYL